MSDDAEFPCGRCGHSRSDHHPQQGANRCDCGCEAFTWAQTTWLLVVDRPYYPAVHRFPTREAAVTARDEFLRENHHDDGDHDGEVWLIETTEQPMKIRTYH